MPQPPLSERYLPFIYGSIFLVSMEGKMRAELWGQKSNIHCHKQHIFVKDFGRWLTLEEIQVICKDCKGNPDGSKCPQYLRGLPFEDRELIKVVLNGNS